MIELGGPEDGGWLLWFNEVLEALDFGWAVVVVISLPIDVLPDSELADQFPLLECGSSFVINPNPRRCLRIDDDSLNFTGFIVAGGCPPPSINAFPFIVKLFSDEEYEGFRSCESFLSFSLPFFFKLLLLLLTIVSSTLKSSMSETLSFLLPLLSCSWLFRLLIIRSRFLPHCFNELKCDDDRFGIARSNGESFFKISLDLLRGTIVISSSFECAASASDSL